MESVNIFVFDGEKEPASVKTVVMGAVGVGWDSLFCGRKDS